MTIKNIRWWFLETKQDVLTQATAYFSSEWIVTSLVLEIKLWDTILSIALFWFGLDFGKLDKAGGPLHSHDTSDKKENVKCKYIPLNRSP